MIQPHHTTAVRMNLHELQKKIVGDSYNSVQRGGIMKNYLVMVKLANGVYINKYISAENDSMAIANFVMEARNSDLVGRYDTVIDICCTANSELTHNEKMSLLISTMG